MLTSPGPHAHLFALQRFLAQYLAKWTQTQLPKPTDRTADRVREWIQAVYEGKRFYDGSKEYVPPAHPKSARVSSDVGTRLAVAAIRIQSHTVAAGVWSACRSVV